MTVLQVILGVVLLILGGKSAGILVGVLGFLGGYLLAGLLPEGAASWMPLALGGLTAVGTLLLALTLQKTAVGLAGFAAGGYLALQLAANLRLEAGWPVWMLLLGGGLVGVLVVTVVFRWAVMFLSAACGAGLIVWNLDVSMGVVTLLFALLFTAGLVIQSGVLRPRGELEARWR